MARTNILERCFYPDFQIASATVATTIALPVGAPNGTSYWWKVTMSSKANIGTPVVMNDTTNPRAQRLQQLITAGLELLLFFSVATNTTQNLWLEAQNTTSLTWYSSGQLAGTTAGYYLAYLTGLPPGTYNIYLATSLAASTTTASAESIYPNFILNQLFTMTSGNVIPGTAAVTNPYYVIMNDTISDTKTGINYYSLCGFWGSNNPFWLLPELFSAGTSPTNGFRISVPSGLTVGIPSLIDGELRYADVNTVMTIAPVATPFSTGAPSRYILVGNTGSFITGSAIPMGNFSLMGSDIHLPIGETETILPINAYLYVSLPIMITGFVLVYTVEEDS